MSSIALAPTEDVQASTDTFTSAEVAVKCISEEDLKLIQEAMEDETRLTKEEMLTLIAKEHGLVYPKK